MADLPIDSFLTEVKKDLRANGWENKSLLSAISTLFFEFGMLPLIMHRIQYKIFKVPIIGKKLSRIIGLIVKVLTSCHFSPTATIKGGVSIPHPVGIVIGKDVVIESGTRIYQQVTLGADANNNFPKVGANVTIYAGVKVIGGITIGENAIVGANSVVVKDVASNSVVAGVPAKLLKMLI